MTLGINTTEREKIYLTLYGEKSEKCFSAKGGPAFGWEFETKNQSDDILLAIEGILKECKLSIQDIKAILVNRGPGSFTGVRVGITGGNALAWVLNIPIFGYSQGKEKSTFEKIKKLKKTHFSKIALPYYE